jgi:hypothetical protein
MGGMPGSVDFFPRCPGTGPVSSLYFPPYAGVLEGASAHFIGRKDGSDGTCQAPLFAFKLINTLTWGGAGPPLHLCIGCPALLLAI